MLVIINDSNEHPRHHPPRHPCRPQGRHQPARTRPRGMHPPVLEPHRTIPGRARNPVHPLAQQHPAAARRTQRPTPPHPRPRHGVRATIGCTDTPAPSAGTGQSRPLQNPPHCARAPARCFFLRHLTASVDACRYRYEIVLKITIIKASTSFLKKRSKKLYPTRWHDTAWPSSCTRKTGASDRQRAIATGHRV